MHGLWATGRGLLLLTHTWQQLWQHPYLSAHRLDSSSRVGLIVQGGYRCHCCMSSPWHGMVQVRIRRRGGFSMFKELWIQ